MFREIYVKDFVLIEELHLDFDSCFSVFTGETGAGKSLLIDAISLLCGERAKPSLIKQGKDKAVIEGIFELDKHHPFFARCEEMGIDCEDDTVTITRTLTSDGKSVARINQRSVSVSVLREMMNEVIDIHSQHDTQYLLNSRYHITLLDQFIHEPDLLSKVNESYQEYATALKEYEQIKEGELNEDDLEYLHFQVDEIENAHLSKEEEENALAEVKKMNAFEKLNRAMQASITCLNGNDAVLELLYTAQKELANCLEFENIAAIHSEIMDCYYTLEEKCSDLQHIQNNLEYDEQRYNELQEYLFQLSKLKRKYGNSIDLILEKKEELQKRIDAIENRQEVLERMEKQVQKKYQVFEKQALQLREVRQKKAKELQTQIQKECADLYLPHARFEVLIKEDKPSGKGLDHAEFYISMNPGEPIRPLSSVASGGELSRLMLGLKTVFTALTHIETVIFDEIDTGVSGKVALAIGKKMRCIGQKQQVFAITHLSPVAACAMKHYMVEKKQDDTSTETLIYPLNESQRIQAMALMSTNSCSESALSSAKELYEIAQQDR